MYDVVCIGNIALDWYFQSESLTFINDRFQLALGGKYFSDRLYQRIGGGGVNVAVGVAKHNLKAAVAGMIGENKFKCEIVDYLYAQNVSSKLCRVVPDYLNLSVILLAKTGERSVINYNTPHQHIFNNETLKRQLRQTRFVYLGNLPDVSLTERISLLNFLHHHGIRIAVNLGVSDCRRSKNQLKEFFDSINYLIINGHEFAELVKAKYNDIHFYDNVVDWYIPYLNSKTVIITEGKSGSFAYDKGEVIHQKAIAVERVVDTNGVGDAFSAGFISAALKKKTLEEALSAGSQYAVKILRKIGAN